jgi:hypothetical protein
MIINFANNGIDHVIIISVTRFATSDLNLGAMY